MDNSERIDRTRGCFVSNVDHARGNGARIDSARG
jgi:hypothetical protein